MKVEGGAAIRLRGIKGLLILLFVLCSFATGAGIIIWAILRAAAAVGWKLVGLFT